MVNQLELFHVEPIARSPHTPGKRWGGRKSTNARAKVRAMLPAPCHRCGGIITRADPESSWHADHTTERMYGGGDTDLAPAHAGCNTSAGGKIGARITNSRRVTAETVRERTVKWW